MGKQHDTSQAKTASADNMECKQYRLLHAREGVKDTTALDGGVAIDVLHVMQCVRSLSRLPTRARTLQLLQCGGCVLSHSLPIYECVVDA